MTEADIESDVQGAAAQWAQSRADLDERVAERLLVARARVGQHRFARDVLSNHQHRCVFCGLSIESAGGKAPRMLVASHIKPWRDCTAAERLDVRNGLTACPSHDVAFDTGLMTINGELRIHVTLDVSRYAHSNAAARAVFGRPPLGERLLIPATATPPHPDYLRWHHENIYRVTLPAR